MRINGFDTPFWYRDVVDLMEQAVGRLDLIMIPKVGNANDLYAVDAWSVRSKPRGRARAGSASRGSSRRRGFADVREIAGGSPRLQSLHLGAVDFAASMGMQTTGIGDTRGGLLRPAPDSSDVPANPIWGDPWHSVTADIVAACRMNGVLPVDGPYGDFSDEAGFIAQAKRAATMGIVGKWAIHPKQIALCNQVFTPSEEAVTEAREIIAAMKKASAEGQGATVYKGRLVDIASIRQAQVIVDTAEMIGA